MQQQTMSPEDYVVEQEGPVSYASQAYRASGRARSSAGAAPYPLYGIGQVPSTATAPTTQPAGTTPFYRTNWFWFGTGATSIAALWVYFGWWRPRQAKAKKKSEKNKSRKNLKAGNED